MAAAESYVWVFSCDCTELPTKLRTKPWEPAFPCMYPQFVIAHFRALGAKKLASSQPKGHFCLLMKQWLSQSTEFRLILYIIFRMGVLFIFLFVFHVKKHTSYNDTWKTESTHQYRENFLKRYFSKASESCTVISVVLHLSNRSESLWVWPCSVGPTACSGTWGTGEQDQMPQSSGDFP